MADEIEDVMYKNSETYEDTYYNKFTEETLKEFTKAMALLKMAQVYVHRIDYLLSSDDGEETFHKRLADDLRKLETQCTH